MKPEPKPAVLHIAVWALVAVALAAVFVAYLDPHLAVDIASRVWACF
ncbi:MAG: hypothetical protein LH480_13125 [Rubrivivax sp.]|nr:hypothetical protein [Rubrivivax sp.]